ncbi:MAG: TIGR03618 family F420-dependent PPOX class oxidoreductase [Actinomycetota bacterium]
MELPDELVSLLRQRSTCYIATTIPDGSPHLTQTWVDTDGHHVLINTVEGFRKARNINRDPRVAVSVSSPENASKYYAIRGRVVSATTDGAAEHIETLAQRYLGQPYPWYGGRDQTRLPLTIAAESLHAMG